MKRVLPSPPLRLERPYPYRTKPHPNPWLIIEERARTAAAELAAKAKAEQEAVAKRKTADEEPGVDIDRYEVKVQAKVREQELQMGLDFVPDADERPSHSDFDAAHEALVESSANTDVEAVVDSSLTRRAELDRQQAVREAAHKHRVHMEREAELGR